MAPGRQPARLMDLGPRHAARLGSITHRPMAGLRGRRFCQDPADDLSHGAFVRWQNARRPGLVAPQPDHAACDRAFRPAPDRLGPSGHPHDLGPANPQGSSTTFARRPCFCSPLRSATLAARRSRSSEETKGPRSPRMAACLPWPTSSRNLLIKTNHWLGKRARNLTELGFGRDDFRSHHQAAHRLADPMGTLRKSVPPLGGLGIWPNIPRSKRNQGSAQ